MCCIAENHFATKEGWKPGEPGRDGRFFIILTPSNFPVGLHNFFFFCRPSGTRFQFFAAYPGLTSGANICRRSAAGVGLDSHRRSNKQRVPPLRRRWRSGSGRDDSVFCSWALARRDSRAWPGGMVGVWRGGLVATELADILYRYGVKAGQSHNNGTRPAAARAIRNERLWMPVFRSARL